MELRLKDGNITVEFNEESELLMIELKPVGRPQEENYLELDTSELTRLHKLLDAAVSCLEGMDIFP